MMWRYHIFYSLIFLSMYFAYVVGRQIKSVWAGVALWWLMFSGITVSFAPSLTFDVMSLRFRLVAGRSLAVVIMTTFFVAFLRRESLPAVILALEWIAAINGVIVAFTGNGIFNAGSADMSWVACTWIMILLRPRELSTNLQEINWAFLLALPVLPLFFSNLPGASAYYIIFFAMGAYFVVKREWKWLLMALPLIFALGWFKNPGTLFNDDKRIEPWIMYMQWWWDNANIWLGSGAGSFQWLGPVIELKNNPESTKAMTWLHNDYLQVAIEQGLIGLTLFCGLILMCLKGSFRRPWLFATNVGMLMAFSTQFLLRFTISQVFVLLLIRLSLEDEHD